jgi:hypothetical protein
MIIIIGEAGKSKTIDALIVKKAGWKSINRKKKIYHSECQQSVSRRF